MSSKNKKTGKYTKRRVITTKDPATREKFYAATDHDAPLGPHQIAAGTIQHPRTKRWQIWLSTNGLDVLHISAHDDPKAAEADIDEIKAAAARGDLFDESKVAALIERLAAGGNGKPEPLPNDTVRAIGRTILHNVIEQGNNKHG